MRTLTIGITLLLIATGSIAQNTVRPLIQKAAYDCDESTISIFSNLSNSERNAIVATAGNHVLNNRFDLKLKFDSNYLPGRQEYKEDVESRRQRDIKRREIIDKCLPLVTRFIQKESALLLALNTAYFADFELFEKIIDKSELNKEEKGSYSLPWVTLIRRIADHTQIRVSNEMLEKYLVKILPYIENINYQPTLIIKEYSRTRTEKGPTILHELAAMGSEKSDIAIKILVSNGADIKAKNNKNLTPLDVYQGQNKEIISILAGTQLPRPTTPKGDISKLPIGSYTGFITSSLVDNDKIEGLVTIRDDGDFVYAGHNGVTLQGKFNLTKDGAIIGEGKTQLPTLFGLKLFSYPDGTLSANLKLEGVITVDELSGSFSSAFETGTFLFNLTSKQ